MHISEGIITGIPAITTTVAALGVVGVGARHMRRFVAEHPEKKPLLGMAGAFIFFLSLIPIPAFTGTCSHPCGSPLAGILFGPWIGAALSALSLLMQAAFFSHGGFSSWGANTLALGLAGAGSAWLTFKLARRCGLSVWWAGALGGLLGDIMTYMVSGLLLDVALLNAPHPRYSFTEYLMTIYGAYLPTQGPIALVEMVVTGFAMNAIYQQRPEVLETLRVVKPAKLAPAAITTLLVLPLCLVLAAFALSPAHAAPKAVTVTQAPVTGMDEAVNEHMAQDAGLSPKSSGFDIERMGDLWNTLLLLAGGTAGFLLGRNWDKLFAKAPRHTSAITATPQE